MVATYTVFGRQVGAHVLAMATLGTTFAGIYLAMPAKTKEKEAGPPINAASKDEEAFIQYADTFSSSCSAFTEIAHTFHRDFLKNANGGEQKAKA
ncbi:MAG: hypothetical protein Q9188_001024 [Gyalolechia gomerana]